MATVIALLLVVPGSVLLMPIVAIVWTTAFAFVHLIGQAARHLGAHVHARVDSRAHAGVEATPAVQAPVALPQAKAA